MKIKRLKNNKKKKKKPRHMCNFYSQVSSVVVWDLKIVGYQVGTF